ncbi:MAG: dienelactone hydrolase family protein [Gemmataceae bacterium]
MGMRLSIITAMLTLFAPLGLSAQEKIASREITFRSGKEEIKGFLAMPSGDGPFPAIVVIHEWWGLNDWIKDQCIRLAGRGYVCLAPDLYRGKVATEMGTARKLMSGMPRDRALRDLKGAVDALGLMKEVNREKLGVIGWCLGGGLALDLSLADKRLNACVICYGRVITDPAKLESLEAKVLGIFGKEDRGIPVATVRQFGEALKKAGKKVEALHEYDAGHGFMRDKNGPTDNPEHRAEATEKAWKEIDSFFASTLKAK